MSGDRSGRCGPCLSIEVRPSLAHKLPRTGSRNLTTSRRLFAAGHDDFAGADGFDDFELGEHADGGVDLGGVSGDEGDHGGGREIHGLATEVLDDLQGRSLLGFICEKFHHDEFLDDGVFIRVLGAVDDVDELADLHDDLRETFRISGNADGHAGEVGIPAF
jgi:hypothetical protein